MLDQRDKWIRMRFGNIDSNLLGSVEDVAPIIWPDLEQSYSDLTNLEGTCKEMVTCEKGA